MEGAPGTTRKKSQRSISSRGRRIQRLSNEELLLTLQKKKECEARASKVLEDMLERVVQEEWFMDVLQHINQSHFQDASVERALSKLCGYPLCNKELGNVPSQRYRISTKMNKVYDITERKNFCSNRCYKAFKFIKDQMHTSPLWLRNIEPTVKFKLMPSVGVGIGAGDEVDVGVGRVSKKDVPELSKDDHHTSQASVSNKPMVDSLKNLHLVASMRQNNPTDVSESLGQSRDEKAITSVEKNKLQLCHFADKNLEIAPPLEENDKYNEIEYNDIGLSEKDTGVIKEESSGSLESASFKVDIPFAEILNPAAVQDLGNVSSFQKSMITKMEIPAKVENTSLPHHTLSLTVESEKLNDEKNISKKEISFSEFTGQVVESDKRTEERGTVLENFGTRSTKSISQNLPNDTCSLIEPKSKIVAQNLVKCAKPVGGNPSAIGMGRQSDKGNGKHSQIKHQKNQKTVKSRSSLTLSAVSRVEKCVQEWFTMESMCFLFGENALKEMLDQKGESIQAHHKALSSLTWDQEKRERFLAICKRLQLLELEDSNFDSDVTHCEAYIKRKPLPDYDALKAEAEAMELKIKAFYNGKMEIEEKKVSLAENVKDDPGENETDSEFKIPLVHLHSQHALRKKIVLDGLNRVLPDCLRTFGMRPSELVGSVRGLVSTFTLSSTNITFKPQEWSLLGLIVIKLLALREPELRQCLQCEQSNTYLTLILMSYKQEPGYLDRLLLWLTDVDRLLAKPEPLEMHH